MRLTAAVKAMRHEGKKYFGLNDFAEPIPKVIMRAARPWRLPSRLIDPSNADPSNTLVSDKGVVEVRFGLTQFAHRFAPLGRVHGRKKSIAAEIPVNLGKLQALRPG